MFSLDGNDKLNWRIKGVTAKNNVNVDRCRDFKNAEKQCVTSRLVKCIKKYQLEGNINVGPDIWPRRIMQRA